jgi:integrase
MGRTLDQYLASRSYSPASEKQRRSILSRFEADAGPVGDVDAEAVIDWWATTAHLAPASRRAHLQAVRGYCQWAATMGLRADDPTRAVRAPTLPRTAPKVLTAAQVARLRSAPMSRRERLMVGLMLDLGLRVGEVARLRGEDVADGLVTIHGKGGRVDRLPMPAHLAALMPTSGRVVDCPPARLSTRTARLLERCGVAGHTAHSLRRTAATRWAADGVAPHVIAALLRHSSVSTSAHYVNVSADDLADAVT